MTDRELLELAAKAANIEYLADRPTNDYLLLPLPGGDCFVWSPLEDDGDAFRLAVKLLIGIGHRWSTVTAETTGQPHNEYTEMDISLDRCATQRRAIVVIAARLGKAMP